jgi:Spy/CpxP family protein refolding chaperone
MRLLSNAAILGPLLFGVIGTLPAAAQSIHPTQPTASFRVAAVADWKAERDIYIQKARDDVQAWQQKLHDLRQKARVKNSEANLTARRNFDTAWTEAEDASRRLETVGAQDWESAKVSFHKASQKLAVIWEKIKSHDKQAGD